MRARARFTPRLPVGRPEVTLSGLDVGNGLKNGEVFAVFVRATLSDGTRAETSMSQIEAGELAANLLRAAARVVS